MPERHALTGFDYTTSVNVKFTGPAAPIYKTSGAAGCDLIADNDLPIIIEPGDWNFIPTNLFIEMPKGFEAQIRSRSGLATKNRVFVLHGIGTVDNDYRGEIKVPLYNGNKDSQFIVLKGDRIAQMVFMPIFLANFVESETLSLTDRGHGGFGSTGR